MEFLKIRFFFIFIAIFGSISGNAEDSLLKPTVTIVLLVRNKGHILPYSLKLLYELNYPKDRISLQVRTDHNQDASAEILEIWTEEIRNEYHAVNFTKFQDGERFYDQPFSPFEWNDERFDYIMDIKEENLEIARNSWSDFVFFLDADVLLNDPDTLEILISESDATVTGPALKSLGLYSNFWAGMTEEYYYNRTEDYLPILERKTKGCFQVPMVHSAVLIDLRRKDSRELAFVPEKIPNFDGPQDDIIVFALSALKAKIPMKVCNQKLFGYLPLPLGPENLKLEEDFENFRDLKLQISADFPPLESWPNLERFLPQPPAQTEKFGTDRVYLINLKRRPDRLEKMKAALGDLGVDFLRIPATDGRQIDSRYLERHGIATMPEFREPYHKRDFMKPGEVGCFMSHYSIWLDVIDKDFDYVLVFEDDIRFEPKFKTKMNKLWKELRKLDLENDWDLIFLGRKILHDSIEPWVEGSDLLVHPDYTYWTLSYLLSRNGAKKLVDEKPLGKMVPVDEYLPIMYDKHPNETWKAFYDNRNLRAYSVQPLFVHPTHYTGEEGYSSDTEDTAGAASRVPPPPEEESNKEEL